jgi:hypothetical protein
VLVDVLFLGGGAGTPSGAAVMGSFGDIWNVFAGGGTQDNLVLNDVTGAQTSLMLAWNVDISYDDSFDTFGFIGQTGWPPDPQLLTSYLVAGDPVPGTVTITGLQPGGNYVLDAYSYNDKPGRESDFTVTNGAGTQSGSVIRNGVVPSDTVSSFQSGVNYYPFVGTADNTGTLLIQFSTTNLLDEADFNGFQLEYEVPEPGTMLLMLPLAALAALALRRRR